jgi:putative NIF3 family GTP cyclohydrolase 1 type 2
MPLTAQQVADRLRGTIVAGDPAIPIAGIATTFTATTDVLRRAAEAKRNLVLTCEPPWWTRKSVAANPIVRAKQDLVAKHNISVGLLRRPDLQFAGLSKALGWTDPQGIYFRRPSITFGALARDVAAKLHINAMRVIGDPAIRVSKVALTHGMITTPELAKVLQEPEVDAVVIGEPVEWEASPYFQDVIASGQKKGLIVLGLQASQEPGARETAAWIKTQVQEVPVQFLPAGDPFEARSWE